MSHLSTISRRSTRLLRSPACPGSVFTALVMIVVLVLPAGAQTDPVPSPGANATQVPLMTRPAALPEVVPMGPAPTSAPLPPPTPEADEPRATPRDDVALVLPARISGNTAVYDQPTTDG